MNRITLGTAQFGFDYGINNQRGKVPIDDVFKILDVAAQAGVNTLDTAALYGESEAVIGKYIKANKKYFSIISKAGNVSATEVKAIIQTSLDTLGVDSFYGYLIHNYQYHIDNPGLWPQLVELRKLGRIKKIGLSIYSPDELDVLLEQGINLDIVQVPYSVFDQRFGPYFEKLHGLGIEINVRSVFLQGIAFRNQAEFTGPLIAIKDKVEELSRLSTQEHISKVALCINFVLLNKYVDKVIIGVDSLNNFQEIRQSIGDLEKIEKLNLSFVAFQHERVDLIYQHLIDIYKEKLGMATKVGN
ncbi:MAG: aldo/keto reductase [bacterium]